MERASAFGSAPDAGGYARVAAVSALAAGVLSLVSATLLGAAFGFRFGDVAPDLTALPADRAWLLRWGALTDMVGFYLLPVPVMLYLAHRFDAGRDALVGVATTAGIIFAVVGSIGAVTVATVVPPLLGSGTDQAAGVLRLVRQIVFVGLWQTLETIPWGVWMLVVGGRLRRTSRWLGAAALVIGAAALVAATGRILDVEWLVGIPTSLAIVVFPLWLLGVGGRMARSGAL